jgi:hypothetical protein
LQTISNNLTHCWPILFAGLGVVLIFLTGYLNSLISGWYKLSKRFRAQFESYGQTKSVGPFFYTVHMRYWAHYSWIIRITVAENALYLSAHSGFNIGHPTLCIPWNEVKISETRYYGRRYVVLTLGDQEKIPMRISERMARNLGILDMCRNLADRAQVPEGAGGFSPRK